MRTPNYDRRPVIAVPDAAGSAWRGWPAVGHELRRRVLGSGRVVVAIECSTGLLPEVRDRLHDALAPAAWFDTRDVFLPEHDVNRACAPWLGGDDPLFGFMAAPAIDAFLDAGRVDGLRQRVAASAGPVVVFGTGAIRCCDPDVIVLADMPRWEGQVRQRRGLVTNLGVANAGTKASMQYKRSYFVDWRVVDGLKRESLARWDYMLDTVIEDDPRLVTGDAVRAGLHAAARRPFRLVPFFDPAPWGGQWMKAVCGLDPGVPNYGWCFDGVPEENSLIFEYGGVQAEMSALHLVFDQPGALLGPRVHARFGAEFPIRFDSLDTMGGGHLSLQVHPLTRYIRERFGMAYTQDESYYLMDAGPDASVFLGLRDDAAPQAMLADLEAAQRGERPFVAERHVAQWPARRHDHFLIPAGTVHCSGANAMVLEISATPYIFTFKLWDWNRPGLDGLPRPLNLAHGAANIQWDRRAAWVRDHLVNRVEPVASGEGWREERTGLHDLEFIETRRHWFTGTTRRHTHDTVRVLNLVQGEEAVVESPAHAFEPFVVHYAETFVVPASVGAYTIRPHGRAASAECATIEASVRGT